MSIDHVTNIGDKIAGIVDDGRRARLGRRVKLVLFFLFPSRKNAIITR